MKLPLDLPKRKDLRGDLAAGLMFERDDIFPARSLVYGSTKEAYEVARLRLKASKPA